MALTGIGHGCNDASTRSANARNGKIQSVTGEGVRAHASGSATDPSDSPSGEDAADENGSSPGKSPAAESSAGFQLQTEEHVLEDIGEGEKQIQKVCQRSTSSSSVIVRIFCVEKKRPKSLQELEQLLGLSASNNGNFAITGHSSSLVGRYVSAINPRVILFADQGNGQGQVRSFVTLGFTRGEQLVEIIASNPEKSTFDFFLLSFKQACNADGPGCHFGDLLTPKIESNWLSVTLYQDEDLKNTTLDCRQCHQAEGLNSKPQLLMQELQNPWTHWMRTAGSGNDLLADYRAAHGPAETYGGIPGNQIANSDPPALERFIRNNTPGNISEVFDSSGIQRELQRNPASSAIWSALFQRVVRGEIIPVPYHDVKVTDPALLAKFTKQYVDLREGRGQDAAMEDHRLVLKQDRQELAAMGFAVPEGLSADQMLTLACAQCHNAKLDQSLSRAKFNVVLEKMAKPIEEIDEAIKRLKMGYSAARRQSEGIQVVLKSGKVVTRDVTDHAPTMPPPRFKRLSDAQIDVLIDYLLKRKTQISSPLAPP